MRVKSKTKSKILSFIIVLGVICAIGIPFAIYAIDELNPYLNMTTAMEKPGSMEFDSMRIAEVNYKNDDPNQDWESVTLELNLIFRNKLEENIIVPKANMTLNYLGDKLGNGWISKDYEVSAGGKETVVAYLEVNNDRIWSAFLSAILLGKPLELKADFEAFILIDDPNGDELFPINFPTQLDFPFPSSGSGIPPFIWSIERSEVVANQPVSISVKATDKGAGISNRTYIYFSINGGVIWNQTSLFGPAWIMYYEDTLLSNIFPINSTKEQQVYTGEIPGFSPGTHVLFKIYLEDYAGNVEHLKQANWVESQVYSYVVPGTPIILPKMLEEFSQSLEDTFLDKFLNYLEDYGIHIDHYLFLNGLTMNTMLEKVLNMANYWYAHDIDSDYATPLLLTDMGFAVGILGDSGVSAGELLHLLSVDFDHFWNYVAHHIYLPSNKDLPTDKDLQELGKLRLNDIKIVDDIEGIIESQWDTSKSGNITGDSNNLLSLNGEEIGSKSLNWTINTPENIFNNFSSNPIALIQDNIFSFYLDYESEFYDELNNNLSLSFKDNQGKIIFSKRFQFENSSLGDWQEIVLMLNSRDFSIEPGFNFNNIIEVNFTYYSNSPTNVLIDYVTEYSFYTFEQHQKFVNGFCVTNSMIQNFLYYTFQNYEYAEDLPLVGTIYAPIIPTTQWDTNSNRTSFYNFLDLIATNDPEYTHTLYQLIPNHHLMAANLFLEWLNLTYFYEELLTILGAEVITVDGPIDKEEIYPYTQTILTLMIYLALGVVSTYVGITKSYAYLSKNAKIKSKKFFLRKKKSVVK